MEHDVKGVEALPGCVLSRAVALGAAAPRAGDTDVKVKVKQEATITSAAPARTKGYNLRTPKPQVVQMAQEPCMRAKAET